MARPVPKQCQCGCGEEYFFQKACKKMTNGKEQCKHYLYECWQCGTVKEQQPAADKCVKKGPHLPGPECKADKQPAAECKEDNTQSYLRKAHEPLFKENDCVKTCICGEEFHADHACRGFKLRERITDLECQNAKLEKQVRELRENNEFLRKELSNPKSDAPF